MKKTVALRAVAAVVLLAVIVLTMGFLATGNFNTFVRITSLPLGFLLFIELSLACSLL